MLGRAPLYKVNSRVDLRVDKAMSGDKLEFVMRGTCRRMLIAPTLVYYIIFPYRKVCPKL